VTTATLTRLPKLSAADREVVLADRPDATDVRPYVAWLREGRRVRHGEKGIALPPASDGRRRAHVFDIDQTDPDPNAPAALLPPARTTWPATSTTSNEGDGMPKIATCSYSEFQPTMGVPVRFTVGHPRWKLGYQLAGHAKLITPTRAMLSLPLDAYTLSYRRVLDAAGVDAIRNELATIAGPAGRVVLLCYERLNERDKATNEPKWCHRSIFSRWIEERTGEQVPELGAHPHTTTNPPSALF
jgi:hypothetical protein